MIQCNLVGTDDEESATLSIRPIATSNSIIPEPSGAYRRKFGCINENRTSVSAAIRTGIKIDSNRLVAFERGVLDAEELPRQLRGTGTPSSIAISGCRHGRRVLSVGRVVAKRTASDRLR